MALRFLSLLLASTLAACSDSPGGTTSQDTDTTDLIDPDGGDGRDDEVSSCSCAAWVGESCVAAAGTCSGTGVARVRVRAVNAAACVYEVALLDAAGRGLFQTAVVDCASAATPVTLPGVTNCELRRDAGGRPGVACEGCTIRFEACAGGDDDREAETDAGDGEGDTATVCEPDSTRCVGSSRLRCNETGTGFLAPDPCPADTFCDAGACKPRVCEPNAVQCVEGSNDFIACRPDGSGFGEPVSCGSTSFCDRGVCRDRVCTPGEVQCRLNAEVRCNDTGSAFGAPTDCGTDRFCAAGTGCRDRVCEPGTVTCVGTDRLRCRNDGSGYEAPQPCGSNQYCAGGLCRNQACTPNRAECVDAVRFRTCAADGSGFGAAQNCPADSSCLDGTCVPDQCTQGQKTCVGPRVAVCRTDGSGFGTPTDCAPGQYCNPGVNDCTAQACAPASRRCAGADRFEACRADGSGYDAAVACASGQTCNDGFCLSPECNTGATECRPGGLATCAGGRWGTPVPCAAGTYCADGQCRTRLCEPGSARCTGNVRIVCNADGSGFLTPEACPGDKRCDAGVCVDLACVPAATRCNGQNLETCRGDGSGWDSAACGTGNYCAAGRCEPWACTPGAADCATDTSVRRCRLDGSGWEATITNCDPGRFCVAGACGDRLCEPGARVCEGDAVKVCNAQGTAWGAPTACAGGEYCTDGACTLDVCAAGTTQCVGTGQVRTCDARGAAWGAAVNCPTGQYCAASQGRCVPQLCTPGAYACLDAQRRQQCTTDGSGFGSPESCAAGTACIAGDCVESQCGTPGQRRCVGSSFQVCQQNFFWGVATACAVSEFCSNGSCFAQVCTPGSRACQDTYTVQTCNGQGSGYLPGTTCAVDQRCRSGACVTLDPNEDPRIDVRVLSWTGTRETTQGRLEPVQVAASVGGGSIQSVELYVNGRLIESDAIPPYLFNYTVPADAPTDALWPVTAKALTTAGKFNTSDAVYLSIVNKPPVAAFTAFVSADDSVTVNAAATADVETAAADIAVRFDYNGDGTYESDWSTEKVRTWRYTPKPAQDQQFTIRMQARDAVGQITDAAQTVRFAQITTVSGTVNTETWYGTRIISGNIVIPSGQTLTIAAGTQVLFQRYDQANDGVGDWGMVVQGRIVAQGTAEAPVVFSVYGSDFRTGGWNRVRFAGQGSTLGYTIFEYADAGVELADGSTFTDCTIRNTRSEGLIVNAGTGASFTRGEIAGAGSTGVSIIGGSNFTIDASTIRNATGRGLDASNAAGLTIRNAIVRANGAGGLGLTALTAATVTDTTVRDNTGDGVVIAGNTSGTLTRSTITTNTGAGVRAVTRSPAGSTTNPTMAVNTNNIFGNGTAAVPFEATADTSATLSATQATYTGNPVVATYTAPPGETIARIQVSVSISGSASSLFAFINVGSTQVASFTSAVSGVWYDLPAGTTQVSVSARNDWGSGRSITIIGTRVHLRRPGAAGTQLVADLTSGTLDARFNYLGYWPAVLSGVQQARSDAANVQGFTGTAFGPDWDRGPYVGGNSLGADTTWSGTIYVTGDLNVPSGRTLTLAEGTQVQFVNIDQNRDGTGDYGIDVQGRLRAVGSTSNRVLFMPYGGITTPDAWDRVTLRGQGSLIRRAAFSFSDTAVEIRDGSVLDDVTITRAGGDGVLVVGATAARLCRVTVDRASARGINASGGGDLRIFGGETAQSGAEGAYIEGVSAPWLKRFTSRLNEFDGIVFANTSPTASRLEVRYNKRDGIVYDGNSAGTLTNSVIQYNDKTGIELRDGTAAGPTPRINLNNIFANCVVPGCDVAVDTTAGMPSATQATYTGNPVSAQYTVPDNRTARKARWQVTISGSASSLFAFLEAGGATGGFTSVAQATSALTAWYLTDVTTTRRLQVSARNDWGSGRSITSALLAVQYVQPADASPPVEVSIMSSFGLVDLKSNFFGDAVDSPTPVRSNDPARFDLQDRKLLGALTDVGVGSLTGDAEDPCAGVN